MDQSHGSAPRTVSTEVGIIRHREPDIATAWQRPRCCQYPTRIPIVELENAPIHLVQRQGELQVSQEHRWVDDAPVLERRRPLLERERAEWRGIDCEPVVDVVLAQAE